MCAPVVGSSLRCFGIELTSVVERGQDEIIAWVAAQEDGTNAGFVFGASKLKAIRLTALMWKPALTCSSPIVDVYHNLYTYQHILQLSQWA